MCLPSGLFHKMSHELTRESAWNSSTAPPTFSFSSNGVFLLSFAVGAQLTKLENTSFHEKVPVEFLDCRMEYAIDKCHRSHVTENWHFYFFFSLVCFAGHRDLDFESISSLLCGAKHLPNLFSPYIDGNWLFTASHHSTSPLKRSAFLTCG